MHPDRERLALLTLTLVPGVGPVAVRALRTHFGSAQAALAAAPSGWPSLSARGGLPRLAAAVDTLAGAREAERAERVGVRLIGDHEPCFPDHWGAFPDLPPLLYVRGAWTEHVTKWPPRAVALVGSRRADAAACAFAFDLAAALARAGVVVVSGLAYGIDAAAHRGALSAGPGAAPTIAVLASGVDRPGPAGNVPLARALVRSGGALVGEAALGSVPGKGDFPRRNRLVAALARSVVIVAAGASSGAHRTAGHAAAYGRDVFVVPARPWDDAYAGNVALLRDGAFPLCGLDGAVAALGFPDAAARDDGAVTGRAAAPPELRWLWDALTSVPTPLETLVERGGRGVGATLAALEGLVQQGLCAVDGARRYRRR